MQTLLLSILLSLPAYAQELEFSQPRVSMDEQNEAAVGFNPRTVASAKLVVEHTKTYSPNPGETYKSTGIRVELFAANGAKITEYQLEGHTYQGESSRRAYMSFTDPNYQDTEGARTLTAHSGGISVSNPREIALRFAANLGGNSGYEGRIFYTVTLRSTENLPEAVRSL